LHLCNHFSKGNDSIRYQTLVGAMAQLLIGLLGVFIGILITYVWFCFKHRAIWNLFTKGVSNEIDTILQLQQNTVVGLKGSIDALRKTNTELGASIESIEAIRALIDKPNFYKSFQDLLEKTGSKMNDKPNTSIK
jgi:hypothetical protein